MDEMKIGDFSQPLANPPKPAPTLRAGDAPTVPAPETPSGDDRLDTAEKRLNEKEKDAEAALRPQLSYEAQLKKQGISMEMAAKIVDDVLFKGFYAEEIKVSSRVSIVLRTRQARDTARTLTYIELERPMYENNYNECISKHSLASSLERVGEDTFRFPTRDTDEADTEKMFQERWAYVNLLPDPVLRLLFLKMAKFDEKVRVVLQEGAIENF